MIELFYSPAAKVGHLRCGPLRSHIDAFAGLLSRQGYSRDAGRLKIRLVSDFSGWLHGRKLETQDLKDEHIEAFLRRRKGHGCVRRGDWRALVDLIEHLRRAGVTPRPRRVISHKAIDRIAADYETFLGHQRGLSQSTIDNYLPTVRTFLNRRFATGRVCLSKLRTIDVTDFILRDGSPVRCKRAQLVATALRSFLGFLTHEGKVTADLAAAVPAVAHWRLAELPKFLEPEQVDNLLKGCDCNTPVGRRDYTVLLLLARLGLRGGEVVNLNLEDINWEAGEVLVRGKSAREDRLPLLPEVGRALAAYLKKDRPVCPSRRVFLRVKAPWQGFSSAAAICDILRRALSRVHLHPEHKGAHLLRRSLATQMLRRGASLPQIGQVLRHQLAQTTEIYAKVNLAALRALAQPWPGGVR